MPLLEKEGKPVATISPLFIFILRLAYCRRPFSWDDSNADDFSVFSVLRP